MYEIIIETTDKDFIKDLRQINIPDIEIWEDMAKADSLINSYNIITFTLGILTSVACGFFANWLYDRSKKKSSSVTTINQYNITKNISINEINIIINYPKDNQNKQD
jgi:hypothetical protein